MNGRELKELLIQDGWTVNHLSERLCMKADTLYHTLQPNRIVSDKTFNFIYKATGVDYRGKTPRIAPDFNNESKKRKYERRKNYVKIQQDLETDYGSNCFKNNDDKEELTRLREELSILQTKCQMYKRKYDNIAYIMHKWAYITRSNEPTHIDDDEITDADVIN